MSDREIVMSTFPTDPIEKRSVSPLVRSLSTSTTLVSDRVNFGIDIDIESQRTGDRIARQIGRFLCWATVVVVGIPVVAWACYMLFFEPTTLARLLAK